MEVSGFGAPEERASAAGAGLETRGQVEANFIHSCSFADVWRSAVGFLFWVIVLTTWITIFQIYRPRWGALGDYLSFTIPLGTP